MLHIYCGDGKGKTTAALGLALRAAGAGLRVHIVQFLKGGETAELASLAQIPGITVTRLPRDYGFTFRMSEEEKAEVTAHHNALLHEAETAVLVGKTDLLILDEFFAAFHTGLLDRDDAERFVRSDAVKKIELVLTGRDPGQRFIGAADYVSEIRAVKHPYEQGIPARKGIEY